MPIRAFLFDMDGLLIDTEDVHMRAFAEVATELGYPSKPQDYVSWIGHSSMKLSVWLEDKVTPGVTPAEILRREQEAFQRILYSERPAPLPGARELFEAGEAMQLRRALVSSTVREQVVLTMRVVLEHLQRPAELAAAFHAVTCGDEVARLKPDPEPYARTAQALGLPPEECLVFEDSPAGVASARAAGCRVVAIPNMYLEQAPIVQEAHAHFATLAEASRARVWERF